MNNVNKKTILIASCIAAAVLTICIVVVFVVNSINVAVETAKNNTDSKDNSSVYNANENDGNESEDYSDYDYDNDYVEDLADYDFYGPDTGSAVSEGKVVVGSVPASVFSWLYVVCVPFEPHV